MAETCFIIMIVIMNAQADHVVSCDLKDCGGSPLTHCTVLLLCVYGGLDPWSNKHDDIHHRSYMMIVYKMAIFAKYTVHNCKDNIERKYS